MNICDVKIISKPLVLASPQDVDALEAELWVTLPTGYKEYMTNLGEGIFGGSLVRIYPPWRIRDELASWRRRINKYWFWDEGRKILPKERAAECIVIGDTMSGDELVFHPSRPNTLFVLPRHQESIFVAGSDIFSAVEWMCGSGQLSEPFAQREFEPFDTRLIPTGHAGLNNVVDPEGHNLQDLIDLGRVWAARHSPLQIAERELQRYLKNGRTVEKVYEALILEGDLEHESGYIVEYQIYKSENGTEVGTFRWSQFENSYGYSFTPHNKR
jgi:hypothetical protein